MIRIIIAEDVRILRDTLATVLSLEDDFDVVATVERGDEVAGTAVRVRADVALLDIALPGIDGLTAAARLRELLPVCRVLMLTGMARPGYLRRALTAQVAGFLLKHSPPEELVDAIRKVAAGDRVVDSSLAMRALETMTSPLAEREADVLRMAATGAEPQEIAAALSLSLGTVRNYLTSAVVKLSARNRVDAIRIATDEGWL
ncbi:response regulator transcription factor [Nonomuraea harbinensis]|uniref:DNA-binding response regulator n=1 Tax=Nonomuraea harbinensis TaxID=1286938 RepID=A0ABW1C6N3_9ACTN|nr:response regulator transcription factor [Nonomuraea harbinensis]